MHNATMQKLTAADPETHSPDLVAENLAALRALFPELITEGPDGVAVNVDVLKSLVGDKTVTDAEEKYGLNWHGKRRARQLALTPSTGTLRPCPEESVDWDTTKNLMIEGDNLEVLKLLQKSYAGKVKLIYIDPPYNTGRDFVYPDNFQDNIKNYLELTGQTGEGGVKLSSNTEASGRFHTDWLNMMYPRLKLAHNLLRDDGVVFISIADHEVHNLRCVMNGCSVKRTSLLLRFGRKCIRPRILRSTSLKIMTISSCMPRIPRHGFQSYFREQRKWRLAMGIQIMTHEGLGNQVICQRETIMEKALIRSFVLLGANSPALRLALIGVCRRPSLKS